MAIIAKGERIMNTFNKNFAKSKIKRAVSNNAMFLKAHNGLINSVVIASSSEQNKLIEQAERIDSVLGEFVRKVHKN